jgi:hypothetical protein
MMHGVGAEGGLPCKAFPVSCFGSFEFSGGFRVLQDSWIKI